MAYQLGTLIEAFKASTNLYFCLLLIRDNNPSGLLVCDRFINCTLHFNGPLGNPMEAYLEVLSSKCPNAYSEFIDTEVTSRGDYDMAEMITELHLRNIPDETLPRHFFCKMNRLTKLVLCRNHTNDDEGSILSDNHQPFYCTRRIIHLKYTNERSLFPLKIKGIFGFSNLRILEITDFPKCSFLKNKVFASLSQLQKLDLSNNSLTSLDQREFEGMGHLTDLRLNHNRLTQDHLGSLQYLINLKVLQLSYNDLSDLDSWAIWGWHSPLMEFVLNHNHIVLLSKKALRAFKRLRWLSLIGNKISYIERGAFEKMEQLVEVRLDQNRLTIIGTEFQFGFNHYINSTNGNQTTNVRAIHLASNRLNTFNFDDFTPDVQQLDLSRNEIRQIDSSSRNLTLEMALKSLDLSRNKIKYLESIVLPKRLEFLNLSHNEIQLFTFPKDPVHGEFIIPSSLKWIDLSFNRLQMVCHLPVMPFNVDTKMKILYEQNPLRCACESHRIDVKHVKFVSSIESSCSATFGNASAESSNTVNANFGVTKVQLWCTDPSNWKCQCNTFGSYSATCGLACPASCTCYISHNFTLYYITCRKQNLVQIPRMPIDPKLSVLIDFSKNPLETLNTSSFSSYPMAKELYLQNCGLNAIVPHIFDSLTQLEILDLAENGLKYLPVDLFAHLSKLTQLNLAQNDFTNFSHELFKPLVGLRILNLQNNALSEFTSEVFENLTSYPSLMLGYNPWSCECEHVQHFHSWLQDFSKQMADSAHLYCISNGIQHKSESWLLLCAPSAQLPNYITPIWTSLTVILALLWIVTMFYVYRHEIQVMIYSRTRWRFFSRIRDTPVDKVYDAFISYSDHDVEFVAIDLVPGLENIESPYRLCVKDRDFLAGAQILESVQEAIGKSHRAIVVLSQNYANSGWCMYEFMFAHQQMISDPDSRVIVILLGEIPREVKSEIKMYMRTHTYLKWGDHLFWNKLYHALPTPVIAETRV